MRTQVAIIGGGPAGLLLAHLLCREGMESIVLEREVSARARAGTDSGGRVGDWHDRALRAAGLGARMDREGHPHNGSAIAWEGRPRFFIDTKKYTGKTMMAYGQSAITEDLYAASDAAGQMVIDEADKVLLHDLTASLPYVTYEKSERSPKSIATTWRVAMATTA